MTGIFPRNGLAPGVDNGGLDLTVTPVAGCEAAYYNERCTTKIDPAAFNALISELVHVLNDAGVKYDCSNTDNLLKALQTLADPCALAAAMTVDTGGCQIQSVAITTKADGTKCLQIINSTTRTVKNANVIDTYGINYPTQNVPRALNYDIATLSAAELANTINPAQLAAHKVLDVTFALSCNTVIEYEFTGTVDFNPPSFGTCFIVPRIDGAFLMSGGSVKQDAVLNNYLSTISGSRQVALAAGTHTIELYAVCPTNGAPAYATVGSTASSASWSISVLRAIT